MKVRWTPRAAEDLVAIARYIAEDNPTAARTHAARLKAIAESVAHFPNRGRVMPEVGRPDVRELLEGNYRIVYRVFGDRCDILTLFEGHKLFLGL
jgi:plasmid stabilization system protein ParE